MRSPKLRSNGSGVPSGEWLIAGGLIVLLAATLTPLAPIATGFACIALGATQATLARTQRSNRRTYILAVHMGVYANLYVLLLGAVCHAAAAGTAGGVAWLRGLDVSASLLPMALAIRTAFVGLSDTENSAAR